MLKDLEYISLDSTARECRVVITKFLCLAFLLVVSHASCMAQETSKASLPEGMYVYLGNPVGSGQPRIFVINNSGQVRWQGGNRGNSLSRDVSPTETRQSTDLNRNQDEDLQGQPEERIKPAKPGSESNFESYNYPVIKWKAKAVPGEPYGVAQLATTYDSDAYGTGKAKFKLTIFRCQKTSRQVTLLDKDGFALCTSHPIYPTQVPGTELVEGQQEIYIREDVYRRAYDYAVQ